MALNTQIFVSLLINTSIVFQPKLSINDRAEVVKLLPVIIPAALFCSFCKRSFSVELQHPPPPPVVPHAFIYKKKWRVNVQNTIMKEDKTVFNKENPLTVEPMNVYVRNTPIAVCRYIVAPVFAIISNKLRQLRPVWFYLMHFANQRTVYSRVTIPVATLAPGRMRACCSGPARLTGLPR